MMPPPPKHNNKYTRFRYSSILPKYICTSQNMLDNSGHDDTTTSRDKMAMGQWHLCWRLAALIITVTGRLQKVAALSEERLVVDNTCSQSILTWMDMGMDMGWTWTWTWIYRNGRIWIYLSSKKKQL